MAKQQEFIELFPKYDTDKDGYINSEQFINLVGQLGVNDLYPGSVSNMIRKLNYEDPQKLTISIQQATQYFLSLETPSKHDIWKNKYSLHSLAGEIRKSLKGNAEESATAAAPGSTNQKEEVDDKPHRTNVSILIGPTKPIYNSQIDIQIQKRQKQDVPKPFIKLVLVSKTVQRAKSLQVLFKHNLTTFLTLLGQDISDWNDELQKMFHISSTVNDTTTTFFITTTNQDVIDLIRIFTSLFELSFSSTLSTNAHINFQFDYDFEKFYTQTQSSFYDIFIKDCRLTVSSKIFNAFKGLREYFLKAGNDVFCNLADSISILAFLMLEEVEADLEFDNNQIGVQYELQSKNELNELLKDMGNFFRQLQQGGMKIFEMIELLDESISIEAVAGEWKVKVFLILKNLNKLILNATKQSEQTSSQTNVDVNSQIQTTQFTEPVILKKSSRKKSFDSEKSI